MEEFILELILKVRVKTENSLVTVTDKVNTVSSDKHEHVISIYINVYNAVFQLISTIIRFIKNNKNELRILV